MKWSWKLVRIAGIDVYMHATFLLLIGWVGFTHWIEQRSLTAVLGGIGFILLLFLLVVAHEYGHALTARRFGIRTRDITLYPIGGVARLERMPEKPIEELWVALAGPAVNVVIAAGLFAWLWVQGALVPLDQLTVSTGSLAERLLVVNVSLFLFNLIPAFPMDGGRILRAILVQKFPKEKATAIAAKISDAVYSFGVQDVLIPLCDLEFKIASPSNHLVCRCFVNSAFDVGTRKDTRNMTGGGYHSVAVL